MRRVPLTSEGKMQECKPESNVPEKTVMIATALGLFCRIIAVGALSLWAAVSVLGLNDDSTVSSLGLVIAAAAGVVLIVYLVRVRRRERAVTRGQLEPSRRSARREVAGVPPMGL